MKSQREKWRVKNTALFNIMVTCDSELNRNVRGDAINPKLSEGVSPVRKHIPKTASLRREAARAR